MIISTPMSRAKAAKSTQTRVVKAPGGTLIYCTHSAVEPLDSLIDNPRNPNTHPAAQLKLLGKILRKGWRYSIVVSTRSGMIVKGHGRKAAARLEGLSYAPIDYQHYESEAEEYADMLADNRIAEFSERDRGALKELLSELDTGEIDMDLTGYDLTTLEELMTAAAPPSEFPSVDGNLPTQWECPKCKFKWSGNSGVK